MPCNEGIVHTFGRVRKAGQTIQLPELLEALAASGQDLVGIALMPHIKNALVPRGQLDRAEVGGKMSARP